jgi:enoyl-CoA hydratase
MVDDPRAVVGFPEVTIGLIPGAGGTQRLTRVVGKAKAMEMILTGRMMDAQEAERANLVARVVPAADLLDEAIKLAETIGEKSQPVVAMAKAAVNAAYETTLSQGVKYERAVFYSSFATADRREGMQAFADKRSPNFTNG